MINRTRLDRAAMLADYEIECDACGEIIEKFDMESWNNLIQTLRNEGWRMLRQGKEWCHYCPDCTY